MGGASLAVSRRKPVGGSIIAARIYPEMDDVEIGLCTSISNGNETGEMQTVLKATGGTVCGHARSKRSSVVITSCEWHQQAVEASQLSTNYMNPETHHEKEVVCRQN